MTAYDDIFVSLKTNVDAAINAAQIQLDNLLNPPPPKTKWGSTKTDFNLFTGSTVERVYNGEQNAPLVVPNTPSGVTPVWSFKRDPTEVIAGQHDGELTEFLPNIVGYWDYWHEPENDAFSAVDYVSAYRHIAALAKSINPGLRSYLCLMGWTLNPLSKRNWLNWYPGDDVVDVMAWDCYSGTTQYQKCIDVSVAQGKPWAIAETGTPPANVSTLNAMSTFLSNANPAPEFVCYFNEGNSKISTDPTALNAWLSGIKDK